MALLFIYPPGHLRIYVEQTNFWLKLAHTTSGTHPLHCIITIGYDFVGQTINFAYSMVLYNINITGQAMATATVIFNKVQQTVTADNDANDDLMWVVGQLPMCHCSLWAEKLLRH